MTGLIALTGATGFVGAAVLRALLKEGRRVRALSRREGALAPHERLEIVLGDLSSDTALERLLAGTSAVVHVAGLVKAPDRRSFEAVNVEGTRRLVEAAAKQEPVPRFIYLSSLAAREPGLSAYAASKHGGELAVAENPALSDWQILRPPAVYGPGDRATRSLFQQFARGRCPVPGRGQGRFSLIYVEDLADAVVALLRHRIPPGLYELHDGRPGGYDWSDMAAIAARAVGRPVRPVRLSAPVMTSTGSRLSGPNRVLQMQWSGIRRTTGSDRGVPCPRGVRFGGGDIVRSLRGIMAGDLDEVCAEIITLLEPFNKTGIEIKPGTDLAADLEMDSVAAMNLVMEVEDKFDIDIPINLLSDVTCPKDLAQLVEQQLNR
jgi:acyl carrier protein